MATITFDWKFIATLLAAVAGVVVPVFLWQFDLSSRSLSIRLVSSVALQPTPASAVQDLQVVLNGVEIKSPYLSTLELINDGSKPVPASDFESPLEIGLNTESEVVRASILSTLPVGIPGVLTSDKYSLKLQPLLLNANDIVTFAIITSGGPPVFTPKARIAGISQVAYDDTTRNRTGWKKAALYLPLSIASTALYMFFSVSMIRRQPISVPRPLALATMIICVVAGSLAMRVGYKAIDVELNSFNIYAFTALALVIASPLFFWQMRRSRRPSNAV